MQRINRLNERIEMLRAMAENTTQQMENTPVQSSNMGDTLARQVAQIVDWTEKLEEEKLNIMMRKFAFEEKIDKLPRLEREVMTARYIDELSWAEVADILSYSEDYVKQIHTKAKRHLYGG
jgi:RNA polymerase sigma factor (sigma-70 family)